MATTETRETASAFRRPTADDAIRLAREQFLAGERIEMGALAEQLGINRTTLYRWVGEREQLMGTLISSLIDEWLEQVRPTVTSTGVDGVLEIIRRFLELAAGYEPLTAFTRREPPLALRVLTDRDGAVTRKADATVARSPRRDAARARGLRRGRAGDRPGRADARLGQHRGRSGTRHRRASSG